MAGYKYKLEKYRGPSSRYTCPRCNKPREFVRYVDTTTGIYVHFDVGKCNRTNKCGYHYTPAQYYKENRLYLKPSLTKANSGSSTERKNESFSCLSTRLIPISMKAYSDNNFTNFLSTVFPDHTVKKMITSYRIGTSKYWKGSTIFWQIDVLGNVRTGKIMLFNQDTGKRVRKPYSYIHWVHKLIQQGNVRNAYKLRQCLFGEHLLMNAPLSRTIAVVESEKTAIILSGIIPEYIWLATGGIQNLRQDPFTVLSGRKVILFPDLGAYEQWKAKILTITPRDTNIVISDLLERHSTDSERFQGCDLADYFICRSEPITEAISHDPTPISDEYPLLTKETEESDYLQAVESVIDDYYDGYNTGPDTMADFTIEQLLEACQDRFGIKLSREQFREYAGKVYEPVQNCPF